MSEETRTPQQILEDIASKSNTTVQNICSLVGELLKNETSFQKKLAESAQASKVASEKRISYVEKRNRELNVLIENYQLETEFEAINVELVSKHTKPEIPVAKNPLVSLDGKPLTE